MLSQTIANYLIDLVVDRKAYMRLPGYRWTTEEFAEKFWDETAYRFMIADQVRMSTYRRVIAAEATGKVVVEIGTGALSPLARMCVEAGAEKVYAIEANPKAAKAAARRIARDGLSDRIEIIPGFSYDIELPVRADLLVHEVVGNMGKDEGMARIVDDAKRRMLRPEASFVPFGCRVHAAPVGHTPAANRALIQAFDRLYWRVDRDPRKQHIWNFPAEDFLAAPLEYESIQFAEHFALEDQRELSFEITRDGAFTGLLLWNEIAVSEHERDHITCLSGTHWPATYVPMAPSPTPVRAGERIRVRTEQDMRVFPTYAFHPCIVRDGQTLELPSVRF